MIPPAPGHGFLAVDKPEGPTSHDIVREARQALGIRRVGHTGTLDPFASGLLLLCAGRATRLVEYLGELPKAYEAVARLGRRTVTLDGESPVVEEKGGWERLDETSLREAMTGFLGSQEQVPPAFSAKKIRGEAAHRRVRRGEVVRLSPARVTIHALELVEYRPPFLRFRLRCSTGTYVRALARDLGERLGTLAHLSELRRTGIGPFGVEGALSPGRLTDRGAVAGAWIRPADALAHLPRVELDPPEARRLQSGQAVSVEVGTAPEDVPLVVVRGADLLAIGILERGWLRPRKVLRSE